METTEQQTEQQVQPTSDKFQNLFSQYKKSHDTNKGKFLTREQRLAKYFNPRADEETFRLLPIKDGEEFFEEGHFHEIEYKIEEKFKKRKIYCPAYNQPKVPKTEFVVKDQNGNVIEKAKIVRDLIVDSEGVKTIKLAYSVDNILIENATFEEVEVFDNGEKIMGPRFCPCCDKYFKLLKKQDSSVAGKKDKDLTDAQKKIKAANRKIWDEAKKYQAIKYYTVKGVDRSAEAEGVKFYRIKFAFRKDGVHDKIIPVMKHYLAQHGDFTDPQSGTDFKFTSDDVPFPGQDRTYRKVVAVQSSGPSPLSTDPVKLQTWLANEERWDDKAVYGPNNISILTYEQFLLLASKGLTPYYDDTDFDNKRWVFPNNQQLEQMANTRRQNLDAEPKEKSVQNEAINLLNEESQNKVPDINELSSEDIKEASERSTVPTSGIQDALEDIDDINFDNILDDDLPF